MTANELKELAQGVVAEALKLHLTHTKSPDAPVNYACIFAQSDEEYEALLVAARELGQVADETGMGPVFRIAPMQTDAGTLQLLKIRRPDVNRPERGDADFTIADYDAFKEMYLGQPGWGIITRPEMEMLELSDPAFKVLAYYSHPILAKVLKLDLGEAS